MPSVVKISMVGHGPDGEAIVNTFHYDNAPGGTTTNLAELLTQFIAAVVATHRACVTSDFTYDKCVALVVAGDGIGSFSVDTTVAGNHGSLTPPSAPLQNCVMVRKITGLAKRWARGRIFVSPVLRTAFDVNGAVSGAPTGIADLITAMLLTLNDGTSNFVPVIWTAALHGSNQITSCNYGPVAGVRRSRRVRPLS
jgi:hypothetical protein